MNDEDLECTAVGIYFGSEAIRRIRYITGLEGKLSRQSKKVCQLRYPLNMIDAQKKQLTERFYSCFVSYVI